MKHKKPYSVAHDCADSLEVGLSFVVPNYVLHAKVYAEAAANHDGFLVVDLLSGKVKGAFPGGDLEHAAPLFSNAFPAFCAKNCMNIAG